MNGAIFRRTLADQARIRTWVFMALICLVAFTLVAFPISELNREINSYPEDEEYRQTLEQEKESFDSQVAWAMFLGFPIFNAKLLLLFFGVLAGVSATASEWQDRTVFLLFSKPVGRTRIMLAKLLGAYTWVALSVLLAGLTVIIAGAAFGMSTIMTGGFMGAVLWTTLAMFPIVAIGGFVGAMMRRGIPALALAVTIVAIVAPLAGAGGYVVAMQDEEFKELGRYDDEGVYDCERSLRDDDNYRRAETQAELEDFYARAEAQYEATHACRLGLVGETDKFYEDQGVPPMFFGYEREWCEAQRYYEAADGNTPYHGYVDDCWEDDADWELREQAKISKFEKASIDAPRYLSPANLLHGWEAATGWNLQDVQGTSGEVLRFSMWEVVYVGNGAGARPAPISGVGAFLGLALHMALWPALAVLAVTRRDLH